MRALTSKEFEELAATGLRDLTHTYATSLRYDLSANKRKLIVNYVNRVWAIILICWPRKFQSLEDVGCECVANRFSTTKRYFTRDIFAYPSVMQGYAVQNTEIARRWPRLGLVPSRKFRRIFA